MLVGVSVAVGVAVSVGVALAVAVSVGVEVAIGVVHHARRKFMRIISRVKGMVLRPGRRRLAQVVWT
ncbi:MAG: hypothetical protein HYX94_07190 [Chloroflexi bacterium]|nr:hypothetical protein [Chloroflexota bacterium]